jgi:catechol 2,3-dioxygenase-like lactoylglutathione lyase family enzyme
MTSEIVFSEVAPVIPVRDLDAALDRYRALGFDVESYAGGERYGYVRRGSTQMHLSEWAEHDPASTAASVYLYVSDADALHAQWKALGVEGRLTTPHNTAYGLREFAFVDAEGTLHRIGSPLQRNDH